MMKYKTYHLEDIDDIVSDIEELFDIPDETVEENEEYRIDRSDWWIYIPALGLCLHEGTFLEYDEEEQEFMPDFSITLIRKKGQDGWLYYERNGFAISIANWLDGTYRQDIENMECVLCTPEVSE